MCNGHFCISGEGGREEAGWSAAGRSSNGSLTWPTWEVTRFLHSFLPSSPSRVSITSARTPHHANLFVMQGRREGGKGQRRSKTAAPIAARRGEERRPLTAVDKPTCHSPQRNRIIQSRLILLFQRPSGSGMRHAYEAQVRSRKGLTFLFPGSHSIARKVRKRR